MWAEGERLAEEQIELPPPEEKACGVVWTRQVSFS